jgi:hypothetical protein
MVKKQKNINEKEITDLIILIYQKEKCKTLTHTQICNKIIKEKLYDFTNKANNPHEFIKKIMIKYQNNLFNKDDDGGGWTYINYNDENNEEEDENNENNENNNNNEEEELDIIIKKIFLNKKKELTETKILKIIKEDELYDFNNNSKGLCLKEVKKILN